MSPLGFAVEVKVRIAEDAPPRLPVPGVPSGFDDAVAAVASAIDAGHLEGGTDQAAEDGDSPLPLSTATDPSPPLFPPAIPAFDLAQMPAAVVVAQAVPGSVTIASSGWCTPTRQSIDLPVTLSDAGAGEGALSAAGPGLAEDSVVGPLVRPDLAPRARVHLSETHFLPLAGPRTPLPGLDGAMPTADAPNAAARAAAPEPGAEAIDGTRATAQRIDAAAELLMAVGGEADRPSAPLAHPRTERPTGTPVVVAGSAAPVSASAAPGTVRVAGAADSGRDGNVELADKPASQPAASQSTPEPIGTAARKRDRGHSYGEATADQPRTTASVEVSAPPPGGLPAGEIRRLAAAISESASVPAATPSGTAAPTLSAAVAGPIRVVSLDLDPGRLGQVSVKLRFDGGRLSLRVVASEPETARMIEEDKDTLLRLLDREGYETDLLGVAVAPELRLAAAPPAPAPSAMSADDGQASPRRSFDGQSDRGGRQDHRPPMSKDTTDDEGTSHRGRAVYV